MKTLLTIFALAMVAALFYPSDECDPPPPRCDYGREAVCWCYDEEPCKWFCTSNGEFAR